MPIYEFKGHPDCTVSRGYVTIAIVDEQAIIDPANAAAVEMAQQLGGVLKPARRTTKARRKKKGDS